VRLKYSGHIRIKSLPSVSAHPHISQASFSVSGKQESVGTERKRVIARVSVEWSPPVLMVVSQLKYCEYDNP
jgi:hypothetical protein